MRIRLIRHATLQIELAEHSLLVDPMLSEVGAYTSLTWGASARRNPTAPLPCSLDELLHPDAVVLTHTHFDHFDRAAKARLPRHSLMIGQASDQNLLLSLGFENCQLVGMNRLNWQGIEFVRIGGQHGQGVIGWAMGRVSGFILRAIGEPTLYIAGDTIWCKPVQEAIAQYHPDVIVINSGAAQFNVGAPITMTSDDVIQVCQAAPEAQVIVIHMEAINHCRLTRAALADDLRKANVAQRVTIPGDGEFAL